MNQATRDILAQIASRPPRSKLEPYTEFIHELRRKRRTYRDIAMFLKQNFDVSVDHTTIFDFVQVRAKESRRAKEELEASQSSISEPAESVVRRDFPVTSGLNDPVLDRFRAVRNEPVLKRVEEPAFTYDPDQPLELIKPKSKEK